jgi:large subunit ribosomal protein L20
MTRIKRGVMANKRRKKVIKRAKGYVRDRHAKFISAKQAVMKAGTNAYNDRKKKKRTMRGLWQIRINAAVRELGMSYSRFIFGLKASKIEIDRKVLSEIAMENPVVFESLVKKAKEAATK